MDEAERSRREMGNGLEIPQVARTFLEQTNELFFGSAASRAERGLHPSFDRIIDFPYGDLTSAPAYAEFAARLQRLALVRCDAWHAVLGLARLLVSADGPLTAGSTRAVVERWFRAITASNWIEYHAVSFNNLTIDRSIALDESIMLQPNGEVRLPVSEPGFLLDAYVRSQPKLWAVLREVASSRSPNAEIRHYPFPFAVGDCLSVLVSPLVTPGCVVRWDGPTPLRVPEYFGESFSQTEGSVRLSRGDIAKIRALYRETARRRGNDYWSGMGELPTKLNRLPTALSFLKQAGSDHNVFTSSVPLATCLEALVGPEDGQEISNRVAQRTALLAGLTDDEIVDVWKHVRRLYTLRSKLLHTGSLGNRDARYIRKGMVPPWTSSTRSAIHGGDFSAPRHVSLEITRRAVSAAWEIEMKRPREGFDPARLDEAVLRMDCRRKLRRLVSTARRSPVREWLQYTHDQDYIRETGLTWSQEERES